VAIAYTYSKDYCILKSGELVGHKALFLLGDPIVKVDSVKTIIARQWEENAQFVIEELKRSDNSITVDFENRGLIGFLQEGRWPIYVAIGYFGGTMPLISVKQCHFKRYCNYIKN